MKVLPSASSKVYDVVFLVEATPSLSTHFDIIKQSYLHPTLEHFNDGPSDDTDHGCDYSCTLYGLVTFSTSDMSPYPTIQAWQPTISTYQLEHSFDEIKFSGTMGDSYSHLADGLSCVMQVFDDIDTLRDARVTTAEKHCIVVCNSPPGDIPGQCNATYCGYTMEQLLLLMNEKGINISIISPRKIPALFRLFEKAGGDLSSMRTTNYATDSRHLVLLKGYQLKERPRSPAAVTGKFDKDAVKAEPVTMGIPSSVAIVNQVNSPAQGPFSQAGPTSVTFIKSNPTVAVAVASPAADTTFKVPSATTQVPSVASPAAPVTVQPPAPQPSQVHQPHTQRMTNPVSVSVTPQQPGPVPPGAREAADKILNQITHDQRFSAPMPAQPVVQQPPVQVAATRVTVPAQIVRAPPPSSVAVSITQVGPMFTPGMNPNQQQHLVTSQQHNVAIRQTSQPTTTVVNPETMNPGQPLASVVPHPQMKLVWTGALEWLDKTPADPTSKITRTLACHVYNGAGEPEINTSKWPSKLTLQHLPSFWLQPLQHLFNKCRTLQFRFAKNDSEALKSLTNKFFKQSLAGCIHFPPMAQCDIRIMMLLYSKGKQQFMGLIPTEQTALLENFKTIVQRHRESKKPGAQKVAAGAPAAGFAGQQQAFPSQQAQQQGFGLMDVDTNLALDPMLMLGYRPISPLYPNPPPFPPSCSPRVLSSPTQVMSTGAISGNVIPMSQTVTAATTQQAPGGIMATGQQQPQPQQQQQPQQTPQQVDSVEAERRLNLQQMHNLQQQLAAAKQKELAFQQQVEKKKKAMETIAARQQIMPQMAGDQQTDTRFTQNMLQAAVAQQQRQQMLQQLQQQQAAQQQQQQAPQQTSQQQIRQMLINSQVGRQQQQLLQQQQQQQLLLQQQRSRMPAAAVQQQATVGQPMQQGGISMQPGLPGQMQPQSQGGQGFMSEDLDLQTFLS